MHAVRLGLTCAGLHALKPPVFDISVVAGTPTLLKPSTTGSAATDSGRFLESAALWTRHRIRNRCGHGWRAD